MRPDSPRSHSRRGHPPTRVGACPTPRLDRWATLAARLAGGAARGHVLLLQDGSLHVRGASAPDAAPPPERLCTLALGAAGVFAPRDLRPLPDPTPSRPPLRAFAGVALHGPQGHRAGVLTLSAEEPLAWSEALLADLADVAAAVELELQLHGERAARRRAEAAAQRHEANFAALFDNGSLGVAVVGAEGWLIRSNARLQQMLGLGEAELREHRLPDFAHPEDRSDALAVFLHLEHGDHDHRQGEMRLRLADGRVAWVDVLVSLVRDREQRPLCGIALVADVTARRQAEADLRESQQQLVLAQRMEAVGQLAGGIAHDISNVLTVVGSFAQLLRSEIEPASHAHELAVEIERASERSVGLTRQLLAFQRQQSFLPARVDLNQLLRRMDGILRRVVHEDVELATELDPGLGPVLADPGQMEQVILNLAMNARDAMPDGGILRIRTRNLRIDHDDAPDPLRPGDYVCITLTDSGVGIDEQTRGRIFEPFFSTKPADRGTGLGLSTAYGIVHRGGGSIRVDSQPGLGSSFHVLLPRLAEPAPPAHPAHGTILLVEDEPAIRLLAHHVLSRLGYTVLQAGDAHQALRLFDEYAPRIDLLLTDLLIPGERSGRTLAEHFRQRRPDLPVLFMSGYTPETVPHHALLGPDDAFLHKPFTSEALAARVREQIGRA